MADKQDSVFFYQLHYTKHNGTTLHLGTPELWCDRLEALVYQKGFILWENQGMFRLITAAVVKNASERYAAAQQLENGYAHHQLKAPDGLKEIYWDQGIPVPPELVPHLMSKVQEHLSNPDPPTDATVDKQSS